MRCAYGVGENLYGFDAIAAFRAGRPANNLARERFNTVITTFGENMAVRQHRVSP